MAIHAATNSLVVKTMIDKLKLETLFLSVGARGGLKAEFGDRGDGLRMFCGGGVKNLFVGLSGAEQAELYRSRSVGVDSGRSLNDFRK